MTSRWHVNDLWMTSRESVFNVQLECLERGEYPGRRSKDVSTVQIGGSASMSTSQHSWDVEPMLDQCWSTVCDAGPTLTRHWFNASWRSWRFNFAGNLRASNVSGCQCHLIYFTIVRRFSRPSLAYTWTKLSSSFIYCQGWYFEGCV